MEYSSLEKFSKECGYKSKTVKKNIKIIPGVIFDSNGEPMFLKGTRYPYSKRWINTDDDFKIMVTILKCLSSHKYLSNDMLHLNEYDFEDIIKKLLSIEYIYINNSPNRYGTNGYSITIKGDMFLKNNKHKTICELSEVLGTFVGAFVYQLSELNK